MKLYAIATEASEDGEWAGPYTDPKLLQRSLEIIRLLDPEAEIITVESDPYADQILAGLRPYKIHVDLVDGVPQLPAEVHLTWPPAEIEGITLGTLESQDYFAWAKSEKDALRRLAHINQEARSQVSQGSNNVPSKTSVGAL